MHDKLTWNLFSQACRQMLIRTVTTAVLIVALAITAILLYGAHTPGGLDKFMGNTRCLFEPELYALRRHLNLSWFVVFVVCAVATGSLISYLARREIRKQTGKNIPAIWLTFYHPPRRDDDAKVYQMYIAARFMIGASLVVNFVLIVGFIAPVWNSAVCAAEGYL